MQGTTERDLKRRVCRAERAGARRNEGRGDAEADRQDREADGRVRATGRPALRSPAWCSSRSRSPPDAEPGERELRLATPRGVSNPLVFHVGQLPEVSRKPMLTADFQVLGKEELALRKRPPDEVEQRITVPCTVNGQIASGEVNRYRFEARKGQRLVISAAARQLIPYIADAVPGWFQPVLALYDANGKELAYNDDYRFKPDPIILFEVPQDGEYVFSITDAIYRGREDFVYRVTIGELPFVTSIFPLGGQVGGRGNDRDERLEPGDGRADAASGGRRAGRPSGSPRARTDSSPTACPSPWTRCRKASTRNPTTTRRTPRR